MCSRLPCLTTSCMQTYVFEIVPVVNIVNGVSTTRPQLKLVVKEEGTAPVTAINNMGNYIVQAMGQKVGRHAGWPRKW